MPADPITADVSDRICKHMNKDHSSALITYAKIYGGLSSQPSSARMLTIKQDSMELEVDGEIINIFFDHTLRDSEDAHKTLVAMLRDIPKDDT